MTGTAPPWLFGMLAAWCVSSSCRGDGDPGAIPPISPDEPAVAGAEVNTLAAPTTDVAEPEAAQSHESVDGDQEHPTEPPDKPRNKGCEGGKRSVGERWQQECNTCWCREDGAVLCTRKACNRPEPDPAQPN